MKIRCLWLERKLFFQGSEDKILDDIETNSPISKAILNCKRLDFVEVEVLHYTEETWMKTSKREFFFKEIYNLCRHFRPQFVMLMGGDEIDKNISYFFKKLQSDFGCKIFVQFFYISGQMRVAQQWVSIADFLAFGEHSSYFRKFENSKIIFNPVPPDLADITANYKEKDIDVCFLGDINMHKSRRNYIRFLKKKGVDILIGGGYGRGRLPAEQFYNLMGRSKIVLNFCGVPDGRAVLKERPFEVMGCKALLFEEFGSELDRLFVPEQEFILFKNKFELIEKIHYYLNCDGELQEIAMRAHEKYLRLYNQQNIWSYIFMRMGGYIPKTTLLDKNFLEYTKVVESIQTEGTDSPLQIHRSEIGWRKTKRILITICKFFLPKIIVTFLRKRLFQSL